jgi:hypothetical protein
VQHFAIRRALIVDLYFVSLIDGDPWIAVRFISNIRRGEADKNPELSLFFDTFQSTLSSKFPNCRAEYHSRPKPPSVASVRLSILNPPGPACRQPSRLTPLKSWIGRLAISTNGLSVMQR